MNNIKISDIVVFPYNYKGIYGEVLANIRIEINKCIIIEKIKICRAYKDSLLVMVIFPENFIITDTKTELYIKREILKEARREKICWWVVENYDETLVHYTSVQIN